MLTSYSQTSFSKCLVVLLPKGSYGIISDSQRNTFITMQISLEVIDLKHLPYFILESINAINETSLTSRELPADNLDCWAPI